MAVSRLAALCRGVLSRFYKCVGPAAGAASPVHRHGPHGRGQQAHAPRDDTAGDARGSGSPDACRAGGRCLSPFSLLALSARVPVQRCVRPIFVYASPPPLAFSSSTPPPSLATAAQMPSAERCNFTPYSEFCRRVSPVCTELLNAKSRLYDLDVFREATCHVDVGERDEVCMHHHSPDVSADNALAGSAGTSMLPWMFCRCVLGWSASSDRHPVAPDAVTCIRQPTLKGRCLRHRTIRCFCRQRT